MASHDTKLLQTITDKKRIRMISLVFSDKKQVEMTFEFKFSSGHLLLCDVGGFIYAQRAAT